MRVMPQLLVAILAAGLAACTGFYTVREGEVYRDRQPHEDELVQAIADHGIRTVVCLRGDGPASGASERAALATGVTFVRVPLSAKRMPEPEALLRLWSVIGSSPRPLLFHCRAGADRTGLASALAVLHDTGDLAAARAQLATIPYGHLGALGGTGAMDEVLDRYAPHAATMDFPRFVREVYTPDLLGK